jgi:nucleotide-binding universal stress UspA family protein
MCDSSTLPKAKVSTILFTAQIIRIETSAQRQQDRRNLKHSLTMKKILCPTDFSDAAHTAIGYAAKLAQVTHCDLTLLNVKSYFDLAPVEMISGKQTTLANAAEQLEAQSLQISKAFNISCYAEVELSYRRLSTIIHEKARGYDLIVMGSNGPDDLYQFLAGTNTYNAILHSEIPVLLVPTDYLYSEIRSIVYAFDYLKDRHLPLKHLLPLIRALKCQLTVLEVVSEYSTRAEQELNQLKLIVRDFYGEDVSFNYDIVKSSDAAQSINDYAVEHKPDILALCSTHKNLVQRLFHKSTIRNLTALCDYPVIVFHQ